MLDQTKNKSSLLEFKTVAAEAVKFKQTVKPTVYQIWWQIFCRKGI